MMAREEKKERPSSLLEATSSFFDSALLYLGNSHPFLGEEQDRERTEREREAETEREKEQQQKKWGEPGRLLNQWTCNTCLDSFLSLDEQRAHFKSDLHRFNVKRKLVVGKSPLSREEFEALFERVQSGKQGKTDDDFSSISGSGEDSDDESSDNDGAPSQQPQPKKLWHSRIPFLLHNSSDIVYVWRPVLLADKEEMMINNDSGVKDIELLTRLRMLVSELPGKRNVWVVLLAKGGHFAGCVIDSRRGEIITHKTLHRYVVRAKAGGRQSSKDSTGRAPKSAGSSLRRHNEMALQKEIRDVLSEWKTFLDEASCIFIHAPSVNSKAFYGGGNALLNQHDSRIRRIPLTVRRPTFKEAQRVFHNLVALTYMPDSNTLSQTISNSVTEVLKTTSLKEDLVEDTKAEESGGDVCIRTDIPEGHPMINEATTNGTGDPGDGLISEHKPTPLHVASKSGDAAAVMELLESGADPCVRDERGQTPYSLAVDKETRNNFRRFMARHPAMWDWQVANVPSPLTEEMEAAQAEKQAEKNARWKAKVKEQKKSRKAKEKAKVQESIMENLTAQASALVCHGKSTAPRHLGKEKQLKDAESATFKEVLKKAQDHEREKRAVAAERRMLGRGSSSEVTTNGSLSNSICSCCGESLAGKTPFYKYSYVYCSVVCVNVHKKLLEDK